MSYSITELLKYAKGKEEVYNKIGNLLYEYFKIQSAELTLVSLFVYEEMRKKEEKERQKGGKDNG